MRVVPPMIATSRSSAPAVGDNGMLIIVLVIFGLVTLATASAVIKRARTVVRPMSSALETRIIRASWLGAFSGCVTVDLFSSAYIRILAGGMLSGISRLGRRSGSGDDPFGAFALVTAAEHLFLMVIFAFAGAALACWAYIRYDAARQVSAASPLSS
jgi:hypothetical protein